MSACGDAAPAGSTIAIVGGFCFFFGFTPRFFGFFLSSYRNPKAEQAQHPQQTQQPVVRRIIHCHVNIEPEPSEEEFPEDAPDPEAPCSPLEDGTSTPNERS